jgi:FKBP12-rapamycin complex-associated protein
MMIKAMEVSGIEGNFRTTCEAVLQVLRQHKESLMVRVRSLRNML